MKPSLSDPFAMIRSAARPAVVAAIRLSIASQSVARIHADLLINLDAGPTGCVASTGC